MEHVRAPVPPATHGVGYCQSLWSKFQRGQITRDDLDHLVSLHVAATLEEHGFREYPHMALDVFTYCTDRWNKKISRDQEKAEKNGIWLHIVFSLQRRNLRELELLEWAAADCRATQNINEAERIEAHAKTLDAVVFPSTEYVMGLNVQKMDSDDVRRGLFNRPQTGRRD